MLSNKTVIVIGGSGLVGRHVVAACRDNNAIVVVAGRNRDSEGFKRLCDNLDEDVPFVEVSTCHADSVRTLFEDVAAQVGKVDAVVNCEFPRNANFGAKFEDVAFEDFCDNVNSHLGGAFLLCQKAVDYFSGTGKGNIINLSSVYGVMAPRFEVYEGTQMTKEVEYIVCKSAIVHLTRYLAKYLKGRSIRVNCISPGGIANDQPAAFVERYNDNCLNKGMLDGEDVAGAVIFLLSDQSEFVTGQNIVVDDGFSL